MSLAFDHVFCLVDDLDEAAMQLSAAGWSLDAGSAHAGQGTRNRRIASAERYPELLHVRDHDEAARNRLRLDRRVTGASPIGIGLRGSLPLDSREEVWLYDELGVRIWVHHDNELAPTSARHRARTHRRTAGAAQGTVRRSAGHSSAADASHPRAPDHRPRASPPATARRTPDHSCAWELLPALDAGSGPTRSITDTLAITRLAATHRRKATTLT
jgi:Glyoxalase-like domain